MRLDLELPWPPSANKNWKYGRGQVRLSEKSRSYRQEIQTLAYTWNPRRIEGRLAAHIIAYPPDRKARDLDNLLKVTLDSLQGADVFENDSHIDLITIRRDAPIKNGLLRVSLISTEDER